MGDSTQRSLDMISFMSWVTGLPICLDVKRDDYRLKCPTPSHDRCPVLTFRRLPSRQVDGHWLFDGSRAGLVSIEREANGILFAEYLNLVSVVREGTTFHRFPTHPWTARELEHGSREPCQAEWIKSESDWCFV